MVNLSTAIAIVGIWICATLMIIFAPAMVPAGMFYYLLAATVVVGILV